MNLVEIVGFSEILMFRRKIFGLLLLVEIKVLNFIGKSLDWPSYSTGATAPLINTKYTFM